MDIAAQIDAFFAGKHEQWMLFEAFHGRLQTVYPDMRLRVMKTCIAFDDPKPFCYVSFPKKKGESGLFISISLREPLMHARIAMLVPISKMRYTAHIPVKDDSDIDEELLALVALSRR